MDKIIEEESSDKEVCLTGCDHKSHKEWIHVDKIKKNIISQTKEWDVKVGLIIEIIIKKKRIHVQLVAS